MKKANLLVTIFVRTARCLLCETHFWTWCRFTI